MAIGRGGERRGDAPVAVVGNAHPARRQVVAQPADLDRAVDRIEVGEHHLAPRRAAELDHLSAQRIGDDVHAQPQLVGEPVEVGEPDFLRGAVDLHDECGPRFEYRVDPDPALGQGHALDDGADLPSGGERTDRAQMRGRDGVHDQAGHRRGRRGRQEPSVPLEWRRASRPPRRRRRRVDALSRAQRPGRLARNCSPRLPSRKPPGR